MIKVEKIGDWNLVMNLANGMTADVNGAIKESMTSMIKETAGTAANHIMKQDLMWSPLTSEYLEAKSKRGESEKIYEATGDLIKSIKAHVSSDGKSGFAGIKEGERNRNGESLSMIAKVMEYGRFSSGQLPRPLWRPVREEMMKLFGKEKPVARETLRRWLMRTAGKGGTGNATPMRSRVGYRYR